MKKIIQKVLDEAHKGHTYIGDKEQYGKNEYWKKSLVGDCVEENQEIWLYENGEYITRKIKDVNIGDVCMSYDMNTKEFTTKRIINKVYKGLLHTNIVTLSNRTDVMVTDHHNMWCKMYQDKDGYEKRNLSDLSCGHHRYMPFAKELPYVEIDTEYSPEMWYVIGHFLAEGWVELSKVSTSGREIPDYIKPILDRNTIPYSEYTNNSDVHCIRYLASEFKDFIRPLLNNSFDINMWKYINLPKNCLQAVLDGYFLGDGHTHQNDKVYSTSCESFAEWIYQASLRLGKPVYIYKQEEHGGVGDKPIYRVIYNANSAIHKNRGFDKLGQVALKEVVPVGDRQCYDITVEDTQCFVFANGLLGHNCEDFALWCRDRLKEEGIESNLIFCMVPENEGGGGHLVLSVEGWILDNRSKWVKGRSQCNYRWVSLGTPAGKWFDITENN